MIILREPLQVALRFLAFNKNYSKIAKDTISLRTEGTTLYLETCSAASSGEEMFISTRIDLKEEYAVEAIIEAGPLQNLLQFEKGESITLEFSKKNVKVNSTVQASLEVYESGKSYNPFFKAIHLGEELGKVTDVFDENTTALMKKYISYVDPTSPDFKYILIRDRMVTTNTVGMRISKKEFNFPYTVFIPGHLFGMLGMMVNPVVTFYENAFTFKDGFGEIIVTRKKRLEKIYNTYFQKIPEPQGNKSFSFDQKVFRESSNMLRSFMRGNRSRGLILDIGGNQIKLTDANNEFKVPTPFSTEGGFTTKAVRHGDFLPIIDDASEKIHIVSSEDPADYTPEGYLYIDKISERVIIAPYKE